MSEKRVQICDNNRHVHGRMNTAGFVNTYAKETKENKGKKPPEETLHHSPDAQRKEELNRRLSYASNIRVDVSSSAGSDINVSAKGLPR